MPGVAHTLPSIPGFARRLPFYYGWVNVTVAALAMVATLPGRTLGLGLITESLLSDLALDRGTYARINLVATVVGSAACLGFGRIVDRWGTRGVLTCLGVALGGVVLGISGIQTVGMLAVAVTLTRMLGQSALSVASLSVTPQWFGRRLSGAVAAYAVLLSVGFMIAFPVVGSWVTDAGWRTAWSRVGWALVLGFAPLAWLLVRPGPGPDAEEFRPSSPSTPVASEGRSESVRLLPALGTSTFWIFSSGSTLYGIVASGIGLFNESILRERGFPPEAYHQALAVTAITGLMGNSLGGWLARRWSLERQLSLAMLLLAAGLVVLPHLRTRAELLGQAVLMGVSGGCVTVLFFAVWARRFGTAHLGQIQGAAQMLTVGGSAVGPLILSEVVAATGSYAAAFYGLAVAVVAVGVVAEWTGRRSRAKSG